jgi:Flp pilus assembly pilin Flp
MSAIKWFLLDDEGTTSVEYAVMLGLILLSAITAISTFGMGTGGLWGGIAAQL